MNNKQNNQSDQDRREADKNHEYNVSKDSLDNVQSNNSLYREDHNTSDIREGNKKQL